MQQNSHQCNVLVVGRCKVADCCDKSLNLYEHVFSHAGAFARHTSFILKACVEPDKSKRIDFQKNWGIETGFASLDEAIHSLKQVDVVSICSPTDMHFDHVVDALKLRPKIIF